MLFHSRLEDITVTSLHPTANHPQKRGEGGDFWNAGIGVQVLRRTPSNQVATSSVDRAQSVTFEWDNSDP